MHRSKPPIFSLAALTLTALLLPGGRALSAEGEKADTWKPASAPLMTRWAKDVSPDKPRPEYPRPLLMRREWKSLNGQWQFGFDDQNQGTTAGWQSGKDLPERILVPFTFESALSSIGKGKEIHERIWYRRTFDVPTGWRDKRVVLNFGAVDWETTVWVNGKQVGTHRGGYTPFSLDVTDALKAGDTPQEVVVAVYDPADPKGTGWQPKGKQLGSEGIWYTRTTGIWQSVWIEPVATAHITRLVSTPSLSGDGASGALTVETGVEGTPGTGTTVAVTLSRNGKKVAEGESPVSAGTTPKVTLQAPGVAAWSPESPNLYDLKVTLKSGGKETDSVSSYTAFRTSGIANGRLTLNGKPYFYRGVLDQGFWPDGIYTPPTDAAIKADVEAVKKLGFNMARKHVKVEDPRWYYWCDKLGVAVWQDMPSSHRLVDPAARENFTREWRDIVADVRNYPCVVHYIPFNENWGNPVEFQDEIVTLTRELDPTRPITDASGWTQRGLTDVIDAHDYTNNLVKQGVANPVKPKVVGEYGGIALPVEGHTWTKGWGYQTVRNPQDLIVKVGRQTAQLYQAQNLSGFVYTQLTDVEQEMNGLLTYDRLPKAADAKVAAVFEGKYTPPASAPAIREWAVLGPFPSSVAIPSSQDTAEDRAAMEKLLAQTGVPNESGLQASTGATVTVDGQEMTWKRAALNPGEEILDFHHILDAPGTETKNAVAYAVAYIDTPRAVENATLKLGSDDGTVVYLNGKRVFTINRVRGVNIDEDSVERLSLKAGRNILLFKVGQGVGGWGLSARVETATGGPIVEGAVSEVAHRVLGQDRGRLAIVGTNGAVEWEMPCPSVAHDIAMLPNGNILVQTAANNVVEVDKNKQIVWKYEAKPVAPYTGAVEIHSFQRLPDGLTMIPETGNKRIIEVDKDGKIVRQIPLTIDNPNSHRDTRTVRKLANGNYLVCHEADAMVREYDPTGKVVWSYKLDLNNQPRTPNHDGHGTEVFGAVRLKNGNTLIAGGNNNRVFEVDPSGKIVWSVERDELPGIHLCWVTRLQALPNGNIIFGNTHAGPGNPQMVEVTRDKKVVWTFRNFETFGNDLAASQALDIPGEVIR